MNLRKKILLIRFKVIGDVVLTLPAVHLVRELRGGKFSLGVDFQGFGETVWFAWLSEIQTRAVIEDCERALAELNAAK